MENPRLEPGLADHSLELPTVLVPDGGKFVALRAKVSGRAAD